MNRYKHKLLAPGLIVGALAMPALGLADSTSSTPVPTPVATPTPLAWYQKLTVGGYVDAYYQQDFNQPTKNASSTLPGDRVFDNTINQFSFGGGELTLKQNDAASGTGYYVDLLMGSMASTYTSGGVSQDSVALAQAYLTQTFGNATFTLGKFATPIGYEVTYTPSNANFSRSLLFSQQPFFNTGLRLDYTLPAGFTASGFVDDGNSTDNALNAGKDYGAILAYAGVKNLNLTALYYLQNDQMLNSTGMAGKIYDLQWANFIATYTATSNLNFAGEYLLKDYNLLGNQIYASFGNPTAYNPIQQGYALYATYNFTPNLSISPRFEQWYNPTFADNFSTVGENVGAYIGAATTPNITDDYTLTLKYQMGPLSHMLEYRCDAISGTNQGFLTSNGNKPSFYSDIQQTLTYAAIYSF